jgi:hypothetical protein
MFEIAGTATLAKRQGFEFDGAWLDVPDTEYSVDRQSEYIYNTVLRKVPMRDRKYLAENNYRFDYPFGNYNLYLQHGYEWPQYKGNTIVQSFLQDSKMIDIEIAYDLFGTYDSIKQEINDVYGDLSDYVCIHVRRGDYLSNECRMCGFNVLTKEQIDDILKIHFPLNRVIFVSDDLDWCKENFKGDRYVFADRDCKNHTEMDLYIQTQCGGNIISNSTFSWWGAYLNPNSKVVVPYPWFSNAPWGNHEQIYCENWIKYQI